MKYAKAEVGTKAIIAVTALLIALPLSIGAQAGAANVSSSNNEEQKGGFSRNAQTISLLRADRGANNNTSQGGGGVEIIDVSALKSSQRTSSEESESSATNTGNVSVYEVSKGDSLGEIAQMFDVSTNTIIWANDLEGSTIQPGQSLVILPMSGVRHEVKEGDTLRSIADKYNGDIDEIREFNEIEEDVALSVGDYVDIPDGEVQETVSTPSPEASSSPSPAPSSGGGWLIRPISGGIKTQGLHGYNAVDLAAPKGTNVMASAPGTVITTKSDRGWNGGYGNYVIVEHANGVQTLYSHLGSVLVSRGQYVVQGQVLGHIGMTGKTTGPHVHFEVRGATNPF